MKRDGITLTKVKDYGYRMATEGDLDADGDQIKSNYVVIVKIDDCEVKPDENGVRRYNPEGVKMAFTPTGHSLTNAVYGKPTTREVKGYEPVRMTLGTLARNGDKYVTRPIFYVINGFVYRGYVRKLVK